MEITLFIRGLIIGFSIAAPVGPIGALCIHRTLAKGRLSGLISGMGAATADAIYGCVAGFGLTFVSSILADQQVWLHIIGGFFLCYLGVRTFIAKPAEQEALPHRSCLAGAYASTLILTLANPMTVISFTAIFAGLGLAGTEGGYGSAGTLVLGVFIGSALWWTILSSGVGAFREKLNPQGLLWVNRASGAVIAGFGLIALLDIVRL